MNVFAQARDEIDFMILFRHYILLDSWDKIAIYVRLAKSTVFQRHAEAVGKLNIESPEKSVANQSDSE